MQLPPFNADATCPACGHDTVNVVYSKGVSYGSLGCAYSCSMRGSREEHLERTCQRCHFSWPEAVLEHVTPAEQEG